jgi:hypothetical protein
LIFGRRGDRGRGRGRGELGWGRLVLKVEREG